MIYVNIGGVEENMAKVFDRNMFVMLLAIMIGIINIRVSIKVSVSAIGKAIKIPSRSRNRGRMNTRGIRNRNGLAIEVTNDWTALPID